MLLQVMFSSFKKFEVSTSLCRVCKIDATTEAIDRSKYKSTVDRAWNENVLDGKIQEEIESQLKTWPGYTIQVFFNLALHVLLTWYEREPQHSQ